MIILYIFVTGFVLFLIIAWAVKLAVKEVLDEFRKDIMKDIIKEMENKKIIITDINSSNVTAESMTKVTVDEQKLP